MNVTDQILICGRYTVNYVKNSNFHESIPWIALGREMHWYTSGPNNQLRRVISLLVIMLDFFFEKVQTCHV